MLPVKLFGLYLLRIRPGDGWQVRRFPFCEMCCQQRGYLIQGDFSSHGDDGIIGTVIGGMKLPDVTDADPRQCFCLSGDQSTVWMLGVEALLEGFIRNPAWIFFTTLNTAFNFFPNAFKFILWECGKEKIF